MIWRLIRKAKPPKAGKERSAHYIGHGRDIAKLRETATQSGSSSHASVIYREWRKWVDAQRAETPEFAPDLQGLNLNDGLWAGTALWGKSYWTNRACFLLADTDWSDMQLWHTNFDGAELTGARFIRSELRVASLQKSYLVAANFDHAVLWQADLSEANLHGAIFRHANLSSAKLISAGLGKADLRSADLRHARLAHSDMTDANVENADFRGADISHLNVTGIRYRRYAGIWPFRRDLMLGKYHGIRGAESCFGNAQFRRDVLDQDYIDNAYDSVRLVVRPTLGIRRVALRLLPRLFFELWAFTDYGRNVSGIFVYAMLFIFGFGALYAWLLIPSGSVLLMDGAKFDFGAWYAAAMGFATLGLSDLIRARSPLGAAVMFANVLSGFVFFGMMIAVIQNKFARRA